MRYNFRLFWRSFYRSFFNSANTTARLTRKRFLFLVLFYLVWPLGSLMHWFCFALDDIFFPGYKNHPIEKPLFILGNLRSGSTFLHRLLSRDKETFTSLTTWDIYLTPSVTQKKITQFVAGLDNRYFNGIMHKLLHKFDAATLGKLKIHPISFFSPKRTRIFTCIFGTVILSPSCSRSWTRCQIISISMRRSALLTKSGS
jgi:hypothetical protein